MKLVLSKYIRFSDAEYDSFISTAKLKTYKKKEHLLTANKAVDSLFFIKNGLIRGYRIIDGLEITHHFFFDGWFATDYQSYLTGDHGDLYLVALTDSVVYEFKKGTTEQFFEENPKFQKIRAIQAEEAYLKMVERLKGFQAEDLKVRYLNLVNKNPKLFNLVPQKYIASYLGVTPESLSRIKENIRKA